MARLEHFVYCEPRAPTAGQAVQVFYNPQHSLLKGQEVTMNAGFNRFLHSTQASVPMAPQQNGWLAGTVQVRRPPARCFRVATFWEGSLVGC